MVWVGYFVFESIRIGQRVFAVGDNGYVFYAVSIKVRGHQHRWEFCRKRKCLPELLLNQRRKLRCIFFLPWRYSRLVRLRRLCNCCACHKKQDSAQKLHKQSLPLFGAQPCRELLVCILLANTRQALLALHESGPNRHGYSGNQRGEQEHYDRQRKEKIHAKNPKDE